MQVCCVERGNSVVIPSTYMRNTVDASSEMEYYNLNTLGSVIFTIP